MIDDATYQQLRSDLLDGVLQPEEAPALLALLRDRPDLLSELGQSLAMERLLGLAAEPEQETARFSEEVTQRIQTAPQGEVFARSVRQRITPKPKRLPWPRVALPLAAAIALLAIGTWFFGRSTPLARVSGLNDVTWSSETSLQNGDILQAGQTIEIDSGLLALSLPGRGIVVLEGRSSLQVRGEKLFTLEFGRATFTVTPGGGQGLTVDTPHGSVVDLGTAFALEVTEDACELHVLDGEVEFTGNGEAPTSMLAGEALRASASETVPIASRGDSFVQRLAEPGGNRSHVRWSCQEGNGLVSSPSGNASAEPLHLRSSLPDGALPVWDRAEGRRGLRFDGEQSYAQSSYAGVLGSTPRTVALWVRVPSSWSPKDGGALVSWGRSQWQKPGLLFELTLNRDPAKGPLGAPQLDTFGISATALRSLSDDQWHHLAVTTHQGSDEAPSTQVLFYLDGHLLGSAPRSIPRINTVASGGDRGVVVGRTVQGLTSPEPPKEAFFRGMLSEVVLIEKALTAQEIQRLIYSGDPW